MILGNTQFELPVSSNEIKRMFSDFSERLQMCDIFVRKKIDYEISMNNNSSTSKIWLKFSQAKPIFSIFEKNYQMRSSAN